MMKVSFKLILRLLYQYHIPCLEKFVVGLASSSIFAEGLVSQLINCQNYWGAWNIPENHSGKLESAFTISYVDMGIKIIKQLYN